MRKFVEPPFLMLLGTCSHKCSIKNILQNITLNFRSSKQILTSEKDYWIFSDVSADTSCEVRVYSGGRCVAVCLRRCISVREWVLGPVRFYEPADRQTSGAGLTHLPKHQARETSNGGKWLHRCKVEPPSANLHSNQMWKLMQIMNQPLLDQNIHFCVVLCLPDISEAHR